MDNDYDELACTEVVSKLGHPLACSFGKCYSKLRTLRAASVHYPVLRNMLYTVYNITKCHSTKADIDNALFVSDYEIM